MKTDPTATALATLVAQRDLDRLGAHLTDEVRLRALLPGGPVEEHGRAAVMNRFDEWFGGYRTVVLEEAAGGRRRPPARPLPPRVRTGPLPAP